jgi:hypothetical protein
LKRRFDWRMGNEVILAAERMPVDNLPEIAKEIGGTRTVGSQALMCR